jgi:hypothetical protein
VQREDLKVGEEYYTARADVWATGQLGGRMRLLSLTPEPGYSDRDIFLPCEWLHMRNGEVVSRHGVVEITGIYGTWAEVGAPLLARHDEYDAEAKRINKRYRKALEQCVETLRACGVAAHLKTWHGVQRPQYTIEIAPTFPAMLAGLFTTEE